MTHPTDAKPGMTETCSHKFVDSPSCLKCGWTPADAAEPIMTEADIADALKRYHSVVDAHHPEAVIHVLAKAVVVLLAEAGNLRAELAKRDAGKPWSEQCPECGQDWPVDP